MKLLHIQIYSLLLSLCTYSSQVEFEPLLEDADSSDLIVLFRVKSSIINDRYRYFQNGIKKHIGSTKEIIGYPEKIIKGDKSFHNRLLQFECSFKSPVHYDSLGNMVCRFFDLDKEYAYFEVIPEKTYLLFFNVNEDTSLWLRRAEYEEEICSMAHYIKNDKEIRSYCRCIEEKKKLNPENEIEELKKELELEMQKSESK